MLIRFAFAICTGIVLFPGQPVLADNETIAGYIENAWIGTPAIKLAAKLDTGAKTSSINAKGYKKYQNGNHTYVRFTIFNKHGHSLFINAPISRYVKIRRANAKTISRPVIRLKVCVAGKTATTEFTLANRNRMKYQLLIGRSFMDGRLLVNSGVQMLQTGLCG